MLTQLVIEFLAGIAAGVFAGVTGAGGGLLLVPILVWLGIPALASIATSNLAILAGASSGTWTNARRYHLPWRPVIMLAIPAILIAPFGVVLARRSPEVVLLLAFAAFNVVAIAMLQWRLGRSETVRSERQPVAPQVAIGAGGGLLAGLFGVGGGLVMVPLQTLILGRPVRLASQISLAVVLCASGAAVLTHVVARGDVRWMTAAVMGAGALLGAQIGARWLHRLSDLQATRVIQATMAVVAVSFVLRALL